MSKKLYTISVVDQQTHEIVDTYTDVRESDLEDGSMFLPEIINWLRRAFRRR